jgi:very-short-patch-repair endonuclease
MVAAQRGLVTRAQLVLVGFSPKAIEHRVATGWLHRVHRGVFAVGNPVLQPLGAETAALLNAGEDAVLSHESAAAAWGLAPNPSFVAITLINRHIRSQPGLVIDRVTTLDIRDVQIHQGLPVTCPARTLIDCAGRGPVDRLLNEARVLKLVSDSAITAAMARCPGRKGIAALRGLLSDRYEQGYSRSGAERRLRRLVKAAELTPPAFNTYVLGFEVDAVWPAEKLIVEVDGHGAHGHRAAFERDRKRDQKLIAAGYLVLRFTWRQLTREPLAAVARIAEILSVRRHTTRPSPKR